jgi:hypothetical protein
VYAGWQWVRGQQLCPGHNSMDELGAEKASILTRRLLCKIPTKSPRNPLAPHPIYCYLLCRSQGSSRPSLRLQQDGAGKDPGPHLLRRCIPSLKVVAWSRPSHVNRLVPGAAILSSLTFRLQASMRHGFFLASPASAGLSIR